MLGSHKNNKLFTYVGYTNNLKKRLKLHNKGKGAKFTRGRTWKIMYIEKYSTKNEAISREYYIKKNRKFRNLIKKNINAKKISHSFTL
jgi:putative endonuclease